MKFSRRENVLYVAPQSQRSAGKHKSEDVYNDTRILVAQSGRATLITIAKNIPAESSDCVQISYRASRGRATKA